MDLPEIKQFLGNFTIYFKDSDTARYQREVHGLDGRTDVMVVIVNDETVSYACAIRECWLGDKQLSPLCNARKHEVIQVRSMTDYQYRIYCFCDHHGGRAREEIELLGFLEEHGAIAWPIPPEVILHP